MNKVVNINLNGFIFTVDEKAYDLLKQYLDSLSNHFNGKEGSAEIISDIETRIAELLQQGLSNASQVVQLTDVQRVIQLMGEPWEIDGEEKKTEQKEPLNTPSGEPLKLRRDPSNKVVGGVCGGIANYLGTDPIIFRMLFAVSFFIFGSGFLLYIILWIAIPNAKPGELNTAPIKSKRMFRDPEDKKLGGVCGGLGYYFGVDPVWFRIGFLVSFFIYGSGFLLYLVLCIAIPKARTAAEKLQMKGEPVDINNIERVVKSSFPKAGEQINRAGNMVTDVLKNIFRLLGRLIGFILVTIGVSLLILLFMVLFHHQDVDYFSSILKLAFNDSILWYAKMGGALMTGSLASIFLLSGLKLLFTIRLNTRMVNLIFGILFIIGCLFQGMAFSKGIYRFKQSYTHVEKLEYTDCPDTLYIHSMPDDTSMVEKKWSFNTHEGDCSVRFHDNKATLDFGFQDLYISPDKSGMMHINIHKTARGTTKSEASMNAKEIGYTVIRNDSELVLGPEINADQTHPFFFQRAKVQLKVPVGTIIIADRNVSEMIADDSRFDEGDCSVYRMTRHGLECLNTESEAETDEEDIRMNIETNEDGQTDTVNVIINKSGKHISIGNSEGNGTIKETIKIGPVTIRKTKNSENNH